MFNQNVHLEQSNTIHYFLLTFIIRGQEILLPVLSGYQLDFKSGVNGLVVDPRYYNALTISANKKTFPPQTLHETLYSG